MSDENESQEIRFRPPREVMRAIRLTAEHCHQDANEWAKAVFVAAFMCSPRNFPLRLLRPKEKKPGKPEEPTLL